ncbi:glycoside hydrolase family 2 protein [Bacteroides graminisolvens]
MRRFIVFLLFFMFAIIETFAQWKAVGSRIKTEWSSLVDPSNVLSEYPRPIMERDKWKNLNGLWNYAIINKGEPLPIEFEGEILVPFAIESSLSGVGKLITEQQELVYQRYFEIPSSWKGKSILLHFGAVDWKADVWVNNIKVGSHTGGFTPFSFNITSAILAKGKNCVVVKVWDPTDKSSQPRGKQVSKPEGIWYTPVTGIWQTVWIEPVSNAYIEGLNITPDIDNHLLIVKAELEGSINADVIEVEVYDGENLLFTEKSIYSQPVEIVMPQNIKLWSPDSPFLYKLKIRLKKGNEILDAVESYAAMRKYSIRRDSHGIVRLELNNKALFQFGTLDQGWWPDGLYTAPTDDALLYDIKKTKDFGFNMIRKHIKVEPARWYTHCDRLGIIVWQDMPSGDSNPQWQNRKYFDGIEMKRSLSSEAIYRKEWKEIIDCLYSYPCISTWVPFNEAWGQFKTAEVADWTKQYDPTRLVNPASGGNHYTCGDILDLHNYPAPELYLYDAQRATVLGEYGGIGLVLKDHVWEPDRNWGYVQFNSSTEATDEYIKYAEKLYRLIEKGFSAAVYTQITDVEVEVNGLMTYDRKVIKLDEERIKRVNSRICNALEK